MSLTLHNATGYLAYFDLGFGDLLVFRRQPLHPDQRITLNLHGPYEISAVTTLDGQHYYSGSARFMQPCTTFTAQLRQGEVPGEYHFELVQGHGYEFDTLSLEKTCLSPVIFSIGRAQLPQQTVVLEKSFDVGRLHIGQHVNISVVVNGVTVPGIAVEADHAERTVTLVNENPEQEPGFFQLVLG